MRGSLGCWRRWKIEVNYYVHGNQREKFPFGNYCELCICCRCMSIGGRREGKGVGFLLPPRQVLHSGDLRKRETECTAFQMKDLLRKYECKYWH